MKLRVIPETEQLFQFRPVFVVKANPVPLFPKVTSRNLSVVKGVTPIFEDKRLKTIARNKKPGDCFLVTG